MKTTFVKNEIELLYLIQILAAKLQPGKTEILNESTTWLLIIQKRVNLSCLLYKIERNSMGFHTEFSGASRCNFQIDYKILTVELN